MWPSIIARQKANFLRLAVTNRSEILIQLFGWNLARHVKISPQELKHIVSFSSIEVIEVKYIKTDFFR